ncbi:MAG: hypothetical protein ACE15E_17565, partial [Acidobacteriota bacterium]
TLESPATIKAARISMIAGARNFVAKIQVSVLKDQANDEKTAGDLTKLGRTTGTCPAACDQSLDPQDAA